MSSRLSGWLRGSTEADGSAEGGGRRWAVLGFGARARRSRSHSPRRRRTGETPARVGPEPSPCDGLASQGNEKEQRALINLPEASERPATARAGLGFPRAESSDSGQGTRRPASSHASCRRPATIARDEHEDEEAGEKKDDESEGGAEAEGEGKDEDESSPSGADLTVNTSISDSSISSESEGLAFAAHNNNNVRVVCRFRPQNQLERKRGGHIAVQVDERIESVLLQNPEEEETNFSFSFDRCFDPAATQEEVFEQVGLPIVQATLQGYNGTIFAYGQTSSGKTYTMEGPPSCGEHGLGLVPRAMRAIFRGIERSPENIRFSVSVSMIEIYMERVNDLLDIKRNNLQIREDPERGIWVEHARMVELHRAEEILDVIQAGQRNRATASTRMNEYSSRSHSIFMVVVEQEDSLTMARKTGKLCMVDLAGSEKVRKTRATGVRLEEAKTINKSLSTLGNVINALTDGNSAHVPYRDSKLTRVLQESLGGNAKTALVICCSPSSYNYTETLSTLRFGSRAKLIENRAVVNQEFSSRELKEMLDRAQNEIAGLRARLRMANTAAQAKLRSPRAVRARSSPSPAAARGSPAGRRGPETFCNAAQDTAELERYQQHLSSLQAKVGQAEVAMGETRAEYAQMLAEENRRNGERDAELVGQDKKLRIMQTCLKAAQSKCSELAERLELGSEPLLKEFAVRERELEARLELALQHHQVVEAKQRAEIARLKEALGDQASGGGAQLDLSRLDELESLLERTAEQVRSAPRADSAAIQEAEARVRDLEHTVREQEISLAREREASARSAARANELAQELALEADAAASSARRVQELQDLLAEEKERSKQQHPQLAARIEVLKKERGKLVEQYETALHQVGSEAKITAQALIEARNALSKSQGEAKQLRCALERLRAEEGSRAAESADLVQRADASESQVSSSAPSDAEQWAEEKRALEAELARTARRLGEVEQNLKVQDTVRSADQAQWLEMVGALRNQLSVARTQALAAEARNEKGSGAPDGLLEATQRELDTVRDLLASRESALQEAEAEARAMREQHRLQLEQAAQTLRDERRAAKDTEEFTRREVAQLTSELQQAGKAETQSTDVGPDELRTLQSALIDERAAREAAEAELARLREDSSQIDQGDRLAKAEQSLAEEKARRVAAEQALDCLLAEARTQLVQAHSAYSAEVARGDEIESKLVRALAAKRDELQRAASARSFLSTGTDDCGAAPVVALTTAADEATTYECPAQRRRASAMLVELLRTSAQRFAARAEAVELASRDLKHAHCREATALRRQVAELQAALGRTGQFESKFHSASDATNVLPKQHQRRQRRHQQQLERSGSSSSSSSSRSLSSAESKDDQAP